MIREENDESMMNGMMNHLRLLVRYAHKQKEERVSCNVQK